MKILYILAQPKEFLNGCWWHRIFNPGRELSRRGHQIKSAVLGITKGNEWLDWADIVVFTRFYKTYPDKLIEAVKVRKKPIVYEIDDNPWLLKSDNVFQAKKEASEMADKFCRDADLVTTTVDILAEALKEHGAKRVAVIPNSLNFDHYYPPAPDWKEMRRMNGVVWKIGWQGGASHWADLKMILPVIRKLKRKHPIQFYIQGLCSNPLPAEIYTYNVYLKSGFNPSMNDYYRTAVSCYRDIELVKAQHIPWYPPELHADLMRQLNIDIGLAPLRGTDFDKNKSAIKFYEYAATGTLTIASNTIPYKDEVNYLSDGDWYQKVMNLIENEDKAEKIYNQQREWVLKNRDIKKVGDLWESNFKQLL